MLLLVAAVIGLMIGLLVRYLVPGRSIHGLMLVPAAAGVATAIVWVALTWLGLPETGIGIWLASLGAAVVASLLLALLLPRIRKRHDEALFTTLAKG